MTWSDHEVLAEVRAALGPGGLKRSASWSFVRADLEAASTFVVFRLEPGGSTLHGVHYPLDDLPHGPSTGIPRDTPGARASEVSLDLDEEIDTLGVPRAARELRDDGVVALVWQR